MRYIFDNMRYTIIRRCNARNLTIIHGKIQIESDRPYVIRTGAIRVHPVDPARPLNSIICPINNYFIFGQVHSVCNLSDYPTKVGSRIFCRISSDYEE